MTETILQRLNGALPGCLVTSNEYRGELTLVIRKEQIHAVCLLFRDDEDLRFDSLRDVCGADYYRGEDRYEVIYNLYSLKNKFRLRLKVRVDEADMHVASVVDIWSTADWEERETYDMFGIVFDGHPDLRRIYMPEEFEYYPLRKDFPLMGIPGSLPLPRK